jgi:SAM-dependent methyltransferase
MALEDAADAGEAARCADFGQVDRTSDPASFVLYLDAASATEFARTYKQRAFALLGVRAGDRILDVGCGTGDDARALARLVGPTGQVVGVDNSGTMVAEATRRSENLDLPLEYRPGDVHRLPLGDDAFDACRVDRVMQHLADPERALAEVTRVVRPGGRVVVSEPDWETLLVDAPDPVVTRKIIELRGQRIRNGRIGRQLRGRLIAVGLRGVIIYAETLIVEDYAQADRLFSLSASAQAARKTDVVNAAEADDWVRSLEEADRQGRFFASATIFTGGGTKPHQGE